MSKKLYLTIKDYLVNLIKENQENPGYRLPSEAQLVRKFEASRYSVRHALQVLEDKKMIVRIQGKGCFINSSKGGFRSDSNEQYISIIVPQLLSRHANEIIFGAQKFCSEFKYHLNIQTSNGVLKQECQLLREIPHNCRGMILFPADYNQLSKELLSISMSSFPLVLVDRYIPNLKLNNICTDNRRMMYDAVKLLSERGYKSPCYLTTSNNLTTAVSDRNAGFYQAMIDCYGIIEKHNLIMLQSYGDDITVLLKAYLLERKIDCIIMNDGPLSVKFIALCRKLGLTIGKDIALILIDEETILSNVDFHYGKITQQSFLIGYKAAELIHKKIKNKKSAPETIRLPAFIEL